MRNQKTENAKVGLIVLAGLLFLVLTLYMIGRNQNLLGSTFILKTVVKNVNGLVPGNNVRFKGINVGTVKSITIENDTAIMIVMNIDVNMRPYIRQDAVATISTDGLMGNKLISINGKDLKGKPVKEGDIIPSIDPVETDEMLRTLNATNQNVEQITANLYEITARLNESEGIWSLLADTLIALDLQKAIEDIRKAGSSAAQFTGAARDMAVRLNQGDGLVNRLFTDKAWTEQLEASLVQLSKASNETLVMMENLKKISADVQNGNGAIGLLLSDSSFRNTLVNSASNVEAATRKLDENMKAMRSHFLFRGYFRKREKQQNDKEDE